MMTMKIMLAMSLVTGLSMFTSQVNAADTPMTVLELFTSQSCSSCPPADALLKKLAEKDPSILALSYHVDYWDHLSGKDIYSSPANTERQRTYAQMLNAGVFTPQLVVDGTISAVGSNTREIDKAIDQARRTQNQSIFPSHTK